MTGFIPNILCMILSLCLTLMGLNVLNMIFDLDLDRINKPNRPLPTNRISTPWAFGLSAALISIGILISGLIHIYLILVVATLILTFLIYTHPKVYFKKYLFSSPFFGGIFYGLIPILATSIILPQIDTTFSIIYILMIVPIASLKDIEDIPGETIHGIKSIPQIIGKQKTIKLAKFVLIFIIAILFVLSVFNFYPILFIIPILFALAIIKKTFTAQQKEDYTTITTQARLVTKATLAINIIFLMFGITAFLII
ncbi:MAG: UbiA family prenyltransferase [Candidatus Diapherotrites archaeon]|nr:UbiA family prenyltransferase [Candidatus Diapherotrites archaeon]